MITRPKRLAPACGAWIAGLAGLFSGSGPVLAHEHPLPHDHLAWNLPPDYTRTALVRFSNLVYDETAPDRHQTSLDIYVPEAGGQGLPVMAYVHGGNLAQGDKSHTRELGEKPEWFTHRLGFIFVSLNYRVLPEGRYPRNVQDVANALAWLHGNIGRFGGDPGRLFLMGHAAGAALASQVATDERFLRNAGHDLSLIRGFIPVEGGTYDVTPEGMRKAGRGDTAFNERIFGGDEALWKQASPLHHVSAGKGIPPFLLLHVGAGTYLGGGNSAQQARMMADALREAGVRAETVPLWDREHYGANTAIGVPGHAATTAIENFLKSLAGE